MQKITIIIIFKEKIISKCTRTLIFGFAGDVKLKTLKVVIIVTIVLRAGDLEIEWIEEGTKFEVEEYDGYESIHIIGSRSYNIA